MSPSGVLHLRGGLRWQPGPGWSAWPVGYGARLPATRSAMIFANPNPSNQDADDLVQTISPGGVEFSVGLVHWPVAGKNVMLSGLNHAC